MRTAMSLEELAALVRLEPSQIAAGPRPGCSIRRATGT